MAPDDDSALDAKSSGTSPPQSLDAVAHNARLWRRVQSYVVANGVAKRTLANNVAYIALGLLVIAFWITGGDLFISPRNWQLMLEQLPVSAMVAMGMTFVITAGYIDLSVGSVLGLASLLGTLSVNRFGLIGLAVCVLTGLALGLINGMIFAFLRIPSFVTTLASQVIVRAVVYIVSAGFSVFLVGGAAGTSLGSQQTSFALLTTIGQFPVVLLVMVGVGLILWIVYTKTVFGQNLKAIGGGESVARLFGVNIEAHKILVFGLSGLVVGVASVVSLAQFGAADPNAGVGLELVCISAVVLGGTPLTGARGSITKSVVGALTLVVLADGLTLSHVGENWDDIARGCLLIVAIAIALERKKVGIVK